MNGYRLVEKWSWQQSPVEPRRSPNTSPMDERIQTCHARVPLLQNLPVSHKIFRGKITYIYSRNYGCWSLMGYSLGQSWVIQKGHTKDSSLDFECKTDLQPSQIVSLFWFSALLCIFKYSSKQSMRRARLVNMTTFTVITYICTCFSKTDISIFSLC